MWLWLAADAAMKFFQIYNREIFLGLHKSCNIAAALVVWQPLRIPLGFLCEWKPPGDAPQYCICNAICNLKLDLHWISLELPHLSSGGEIWFQTPVRIGEVYHASVPWMIHILGSGTDERIKLSVWPRALTVQAQQHNYQGRVLHWVNSLSCGVQRIKSLVIKNFLKSTIPMVLFTDDMGKR